MGVHSAAMADSTVSQSGRTTDSTAPQSSQSGGAGEGMEEFIAVHVELLDWSRLRCLLAQQPWSLREKGWWALIKGGKCGQSSQSVNSTYSRTGQLGTGLTWP